MANKVRMSLVGLDGNAFSLMGAFSREARRQGWTQAEIKAVTDECMTGDYDHLLCTLMNNIEGPDDAEEDYDFSSENEYNDDGCLDGCSDCEGYCDEYGDKDPNPYDGDYSED